MKQTLGDPDYNIVLHTAPNRSAAGIEPADAEREREIHEPLMHVMMESLKIKDETGAESEPPEPPSEPEPESHNSGELFRFRRQIRILRHRLPLHSIHSVSVVGHASIQKCQTWLCF